jgi:hypothetical protein
VHLLNGRETVARESVGDAHQRRPQPPMYQGDLPMDQARGDDVGGAANLIEHTVDLMPR